MSHPIHIAQEVVPHLNHGLNLAGSPVRVTATIEADTLIVRACSPDEDYSYSFPRTPFGHWFLDTIVNSSLPYFAAIRRGL